MAGEKKAVSPAVQIEREQPYAVTCAWCHGEAEVSSLSPPSFHCTTGAGRGGRGAPPSPLALPCFRVKKEKRNLPWCFFLLKINFYE